MEASDISKSVSLISLKLFKNIIYVHFDLSTFTRISWIIELFIFDQPSIFVNSSLESVQQHDASM